MSSAGDFNNDGYSDIVIAAPSSRSYAGTSYVIFGKASGFVDIDLSSNLVSSSVGFKVFIFMYLYILYIFIYVNYVNDLNVY